MDDAGWSSLVARWAHNPKVAGSNPAPATNFLPFSFTSNPLDIFTLTPNARFSLHLPQSQDFRPFLTVF